jgi:hypothetical protein
MSNMTLRKRISLVTLTALGAGLLSVAPAQAANNPAVGAVNAATAADVLNIATQTGIASVSSTLTTGANPNRSVGLLSVSTVQTTATITSTATLLSTGTAVFYFTGVTQRSHTVLVSGGTVTGFSSSVTSTASSSDSKTVVVTAEDTTVPAVAFAVRPSSGSSSVSVELYKSAANSFTDGAQAYDGAASVLAGSTSKGDLIQKYIITVAASDSVGVFSAANSLCNLATSSTAAADGTDDTGAGVIANRSNGYIDFNLVDAFGNALTGAVVIEASGGSAVAYNGDYTATSTATDFNLVQVSTDANGKIDVARPAALIDKSASTTVTIKFNGVTVCTKSIRFEGEVATITASDTQILRTGAANTSAFRTTFADDKGFALYPQSGVQVVAATLNSTVTAVEAQATPPNASTATKGYGTVTCGGSAGSYLDAGTADLQLFYLNTSSGTTVKSNVWKAVCAGDAYTYTASLDKSVYTPGSVATLTLTFKDQGGNLANAYDDVSEASASLISITGLGTAVTAPAAGDEADNVVGGTTVGVKTYQYVVGNTEGDYTAIVAAPVVTAFNSKQGNNSLSFSIKSGTATVSNADVLKSIVALIASINKQIQALQKLILKR